MLRSLALAGVVFLLVRGPADISRAQRRYRSEAESFAMIAFLSGFAVGLIVGACVGIAVVVLWWINPPRRSDD